MFSIPSILRYVPQEALPFLVDVSLCYIVVYMRIVRVSLIYSAVFLVNLPCELFAFHYVKALAMLNA